MVIASKISYVRLQLRLFVVMKYSTFFKNVQTRTIRSNFFFLTLCRHSKILFFHFAVCAGKYT